MKYVVIALLLCSGCKHSDGWGPLEWTPSSQGHSAPQHPAPGLPPTISETSKERSHDSCRSRCSPREVCRVQALRESRLSGERVAVSRKGVEL